MDYRSASLILSMLIFASLPKDSAMQTDMTDSTPTTSVIDYSVALYVLIGIAALYSMATLICCVLVILNCVSRKEKRVSPYSDLQKRPMPSRLETILEENESKSSSLTSLKQKKQRGLRFHNQAALETEGRPAVIETGLNEASGEMDIQGNLSIANMSALEQDSSSSSEEDSRSISKDRIISEPDIKGTLSFSNKTALEQEGTGEEDAQAPERGTAIMASFKKPVPIGKINGQNSKTNSWTRSQPYGGSPFLQHVPRGSSVSPADVKVPFSDPDPRQVPLKNSAGKRECDKEAHPVSSERSPFNKRKNPAKEIPTSSSHTLTGFKIPAMSPSDVESSRSTGKIILPPLKPNPRVKEPTRPISKAVPSTATQSESVESSSPVRRRPQPTHPVKSSPSQSLLRQKKTAKDSFTPGIATFSRSSAEQSGAAADTPRSSSASISSSVTSIAVTVDVLVKKLQPVEKKWYAIGSQLKVPNKRLIIIVNKHKNAMDRCLIDLCEEWVSSSKEATWPKVVDALKSDMVNEKELACDIEREYCWVESNNSKTYK